MWEGIGSNILVGRIHEPKIESNNVYWNYLTSSVGFVIARLPGCCQVCDLSRSTREIHNLDPQPHRHCMLAPTASAPRVTRCSLGKYWSRDFFRKEAGRMLPD